MVKADNLVKCLDDAVKVYGSEAKLRRAVGLKAKDWELWQAHGIPRGHQLGLYVGLRVRGAEASPKYASDFIATSLLGR